MDSQMYGMSAAYDIIRQGKRLEDDPRYQREKALSGSRLGTIFRTGVGATTTTLPERRGIGEFRRSLGPQPTITELQQHNMQFGRGRGTDDSHSHYSSDERVDVIETLNDYDHTWAPGRGLPTIHGIASSSPRNIKGYMQPCGNAHEDETTESNPSFGQGFQFPSQRLQVSQQETPGLFHRSYFEQNVPQIQMGGGVSPRSPFSASIPSQPIVSYPYSSFARSGEPSTFSQSTVVDEQNQMVYIPVPYSFVPIPMQHLRQVVTQHQQ